jgi:hypothetical protein
MRSFLKYTPGAALLLLFGAAPPDALAQKWELGVLGGGSINNSVSVSNGSANGNVGFKSGPAVGAFFAQNGNRLSGELRYDYMPSDLKVSSGGAEATFPGLSHAIHYDAMFNFTSSEAAVRPFVEAGGGVRIFQGTGSPTVTQPLSNLALLTNTYETKGLATVGGGVKARIGSRLVFRLEVQDFISPFPRQVIAPSLGAKISGILHDIVFTAGIGLAF